jgi:hypothetical protein
MLVKAVSQGRNTRGLPVLTASQEALARQNEVLAKFFTTDKPDTSAELKDLEEGILVIDEEETPAKSGQGIRPLAAQESPRQTPPPEDMDVTDEVVELDISHVSDEGAALGQAIAQANISSNQQTPTSKSAAVKPPARRGFRTLTSDQPPQPTMPEIDPIMRAIQQRGHRIQTQMRFAHLPEEQGGPYGGIAMAMAREQEMMLANLSRPREEDTNYEPGAPCDPTRPCMVDRCPAHQLAFAQNRNEATACSFSRFCRALPCRVHYVPNEAPPGGFRPGSTPPTEPTTALETRMAGFNPCAPCDRDRPCTLGNPCQAHTVATGFQPVAAAPRELVASREPTAIEVATQAIQQLRAYDSAMQALGQEEALTAGGPGSTFDRMTLSGVPPREEVMEDEVFEEPCLMEVVPPPPGFMSRTVMPAPSPSDPNQMRVLSGVPAPGSLVPANTILPEGWSLRPPQSILPPNYSQPPPLQYPQFWQPPPPPPAPPMFPQQHPFASAPPQFYPPQQMMPPAGMPPQFQQPLTDRPLSAEAREKIRAFRPSSSSQPFTPSHLSGRTSPASSAITGVPPGGSITEEQQPMEVAETEKTPPSTPAPVPAQPQPEEKTPEAAKAPTPAAKEKEQAPTSGNRLQPVARTKSADVASATEKQSKASSSRLQPAAGTSSAVQSFAKSAFAKPVGKAAKNAAKRREKKARIAAGTQKPAAPPMTEEDTEISDEEMMSDPGFGGKQTSSKGPSTPRGSPAPSIGSDAEEIEDLVIEEPSETDKALDHIFGPKEPELPVAGGASTSRNVPRVQPFELFRERTLDPFEVHPYESALTRAGGSLLKAYSKKALKKYYGQDRYCQQLVDVLTHFKYDNEEYTRRRERAYYYLKSCVRLIEKDVGKLPILVVGSTVHGLGLPDGDLDLVVKTDFPPDPVTHTSRHQDERVLVRIVGFLKSSVKDSNGQPRPKHFNEGTVETKNLRVHTQWVEPDQPPLGVDISVSWTAANLYFANLRYFLGISSWGMREYQRIIRLWAEAYGLRGAFEGGLNASSFHVMAFSALIQADACMPADKDIIELCKDFEKARQAALEYRSLETGKSPEVHALSLMVNYRVLQFFHHFAEFPFHAQQILLNKEKKIIYAEPAFKPDQRPKKPAMAVFEPYQPNLNLARSVKSEKYVHYLKACLMRTNILLCPQHGVPYTMDIRPEWLNLTPDGKPLHAPPSLETIEERGERALWNSSKEEEASRRQRYDEWQDEQINLKEAEAAQKKAAEAESERDRRAREREVKAAQKKAAETAPVAPKKL